MLCASRTVLLASTAVTLLIAPACNRDTSPKGSNIGVAAGSPVGGSLREPDILELQQDDGQWVMPGKNYAGTRYSRLDEINAGNASQLKVAWTFSTGVNAGHEAAPLVVGSTMYVVAPFPNFVFALDLSKPGCAREVATRRHQSRRDPHARPPLSPTLPPQAHPQLPTTCSSALYFPY
jgi:glucose dehydrogenase